ncbi:MAG: hydantoinase/oxoprolinase [Candidatus Eremiobacteraeota bacterium]|nr:hydantoinase/oxoprolinase [Candidatus Eremiobacteraeota bacterium]
MRKLRLGIDVGGTFTDVVVVDALTRDLVGTVKVPTTHDDPQGVAAGIIIGMSAVLSKFDILASDVAFIAHSTTQATNALLEGDVARVGIVGLLRASDGILAKAQTRFRPIALGPNCLFAPSFGFADTGDVTAVRALVDALQAKGAEAIVASQAFGVDAPQNEEAVVQYARDRGLFATSGHEVSSLYGLRARTRTAALNAAILPRMVGTAQMTARAVAAANIGAPLMIMRSDGGVMNVGEIERRPILTLLSGPAAGVAGALLHEHVTDGIFIEVGGTSADCSAIRGGSPQMRPARIGGHRTMLRTLDVRTLAIAGGSMLRLGASGVKDVGPRSAHIAGLRYASFTAPEQLERVVVQTLRPTPHDPDDYVVLRAGDGTGITVTPTCAANFLGYVPEHAFARGNARSAQRAFELIGAHAGNDPEALARALLDKACAKLIAAIDELILDYGLDRETLMIVGGGGGAAALVPYAAQRSGLDFRLARDAEVISPLGVALALVRDVVERTIVDPTPGDILTVRREALDAVIAAGAAPDRVEVAVEIDTQRNLVRATGSGATALVEGSANGAIGESGERLSAARTLSCGVDELERIEGTGRLTIYALTRVRKNHFGFKRTTRELRVLDTKGVARIALRDAQVTVATAGEVQPALERAIEEATAFGDVGRAMPDLYVLHGSQIANLSGLADAPQSIALIQEEIAGLAPLTPVVILASSKKA